MQPVANPNCVAKCYTHGYGYSDSHPHGYSNSNGHSYGYPQTDADAKIWADAEAAPYAASAAVVVQAVAGIGDAGETLVVYERLCSPYYRGPGSSIPATTEFSDFSLVTN